MMRRSLMMVRMMLLVGLSYITSMIKAEGPIDGHYVDTTLTRLAFGSCSKQWRDQTLWSPIIAFKPQAWLWLGDAVYVKEEEGKTLRDAYKRQLQQPGYQKLLKTVPIVEGVYDDHDYGVNDGDKTTYLPDRRDAYLDFLGIKDPDNPRLTRHGLYSSHVFGFPPRQVKVIFLDTRSCRDTPALHMPDFFRYPIKPFALALTRWVAVMLRVTKSYMGDMLGEEQWRWFEEQIKDSQAAVHILVSTVQVFSTNPIIEGWGHFPHSQARLINLLNQYKPSGLVILSGDVHFAELLSAQPTTTGDRASIVPEAFEVTTSGMTHTCMQTALGMCQLAMETYNEHRLSPEAYYGGFNYGTIEIDWPAVIDEGLDGEEAEAAKAQDPLTAAGVSAHYVVKVRNAKGKAKLELEKTVGPDSPMPEIGQPYALNDNALLLYVAALIVVVWTVLLVMVYQTCVKAGRRRVKAASRRKEKTEDDDNTNEKAKKTNGSSKSNGSGKQEAEAPSTPSPPDSPIRVPTTRSKAKAKRA